MTQHIFEFIINSRKAFIRLIDDLTIDELNQIPEGFNNNIFWNFAHIVVSTQTLSYVRTGILADASTVKYNDDYKKDTKPTREVTQAEVDEFKSLALTTIGQIQSDYAKGTFKSITPYATATYGSEMKTIEEVLIATLSHDNLHWGYAQAQRRVIKNNK
ncbi:DinB family protein [Sphingobacterium faecium]|uniref:DinB family protein n=1 Tax=Sphingobacterium faecium TaxID=34087 RepID=UPI003DA4DFCC